MSLLEDDYLGGSGSRGSGKIAFQEMTVTLKRSDDYLSPQTLGTYTSLNELTAALGDIKARIGSLLAGE
jgi:CRISPR-associated protein Csm3